MLKAPGGRAVAWLGGTWPVTSPRLSGNSVTADDGKKLKLIHEADGTR
jgi:hypothetical protein